MFLYDEEGAHARQARHQHRQRRILRPRRRRSGPPAVGAHRPRPGLPRRSAAAARRAARPAGPVAGQHALLLRHAGPHLGTAGAHQGPARGRRPGLGERVPQRHRAVRLPQVPELRRDQRDQGPEAADRAQDRPGRRQRHATSRPATAASATSSSPSSSCNCSTAATCPQSARQHPRGHAGAGTTSAA